MLRRRLLLLLLRLLHASSFVTMCFLWPLASSDRLPLHPQELDALEEITMAMGVTLNRSVDPCKFQILSISDFEPVMDQNVVECNCLPNAPVCHIRKLVLRRYSLPGILSPKLVDLPFLEELDLTRNYIGGTLPKEWASMKFLRSISLPANRLTGEIPTEWGSLTRLNYLDLEANQLSGNIPSELGNLINLTVLILSSNKFVGNLPEELGGMKNLTDFRISANNFSGSVPDFIGDWTQLERLELYATGLEGPIPTGIFQLEALNDLRITDMKGANFFPENLSHKDYIKYLVLRNVNMLGSIQPFIWKMKKLKVLDLSFNRLQGDLPSSPQHVPEYTFLGGNMLSGTVPSSMLGVNIDLSYNNVTCPCQKNNINVNCYRCSSQTALSGNPQCSSKPNCTNKHHSFHINCGGESITITDDSGSLLYEGDGDSRGSASMNYVGSQNWGYSSSGDYLDYNKNVHLFTISNSSVLSKDCSELYTTARKSPTSLIYHGFCLENGKYTVRLHFAEIEITNHEAYSSLGQRIFDIYIQGKLEWKDFNIMEEANGTGKPVTKQIDVSVTDNVLEIRLYWAGKGTTCIPKKGTYGPLISAISACHSSKPCAVETSLLESRKASKKRKFSIIVGAATSLLCLVLFILGVLFWRCYSGDKTTRERELCGMDLQTGSFTLRQIKAATDNFDSANKIGEGGFGSVFKGQLSDGTLVAVKQLSSKSSQGYREFVNEIGMISGLQHPNLVKLYGCCTEGNQLLLVYEYMENNSLARALFGINGANTSSLKLDWATRQKICVGIARGIAFLQEESTLKVVHRDIKATNVLLDQDLNAKISDFGLAKLNGEESTHISTRIAGTIGYMAPEYALWGYLTNKADIYSFGVVALEIASGRSNTSYKPENECVCLLDWAFVLQQRGSLMDIVDPKLGSEFNLAEAERMIKVALLCTSTSPTLRPSMSAVVSMLEGQTVVQDVISDPGIYSDDSRFQILRDQQQQMQNQVLSRCQPPNLSSDEIWIY